MNRNIESLEIEDDIRDLPKIEIEEPEINFNEFLEDDVTDDYKFIRRKNIFCLSASESVLKYALETLKTDSNPRTIEAISSVIKNMNETGERLFTLHEKMKKLSMKEKKKETVGGEKTVRGTIQQIMEEMKKEELN